MMKPSYFLVTDPTGAKHKLQQEQLFDKLIKLRESYDPREVIVQAVFEFKSVEESEAHVKAVQAKLLSMRGKRPPPVR